MPTCDAQLVGYIVQDTNRHLALLQRKSLLWTDLDHHIAASHIAEHLGDFTLISRHLQAVTRLLMEIHVDCPPEELFPKQERPLMRKHRRHCQAPGAVFRPERH